MGDPAAAIPPFEALYAQIQALPEHLTGEILEPGVLRTLSRPGRRHRRAAKLCQRSLGPFDLDPTHRLVEVFETVGGRPTLAAIARDQDRVTLPSFDGDIDVGPWWLPEREE